MPETAVASPTPSVGQFGDFTPPSRTPLPSPTPQFGDFTPPSPTPTARQFGDFTPPDTIDVPDAPHSSAALAETVPVASDEETLKMISNATKASEDEARAQGRPVTTTAEQQDMVVPRMGTMGTESDLMGLEDQAKPPQWVNNAIEAAGETAMGFAPKSGSLKDVSGWLTGLLVPPVGATDEIKKTYGMVQQFVQGKPLEQAHDTSFPETLAIKNAEQTPPLSKERFAAAFNVLAQMGMAKGIAHGLKGGEPNATQKGQQPAGNQPEYQGNDLSGPPAQTGDSGLAPQRGQLQEPPATAGGTTPEVTSPAAALPQGEAAASPELQSPTGIRNAIVDQQRVSRGLPERVAPLRKTFGESWDQATKALDENPAAGTELVNELRRTPRPLSDVEDALLAHETVSRENAQDNAVDAVNNATTDEERVSAQARLAAARDSVHELYDVGQQAGTETARGLAARRILVNTDFSLARMEATKRAVANGGKPLSEPQLNEVKAAHDEITRLKSKLDAYENVKSGKEAMRKFNQMIKEVTKEAQAAKRSGSTLLDAIDSAADKARQRIIERRGRLNTGFDPSSISDEAIIGASHIAHGLDTLATWSAQMVQDFGERIRPFLDEIWKQAQALHDKQAEVFSGQASLKRYKTYLKNKTAEVEGRIAAGDNVRPTRNKTVLDAEATKLKADYGRAVTKWETGLEKDRLSKRTLSEKVQDTFVRWRRGFLLTSPVTVAKLTSAAAERMVITPSEELLGAGLSKVPGISKVAKLAPREGGMSIGAESRAITEGFVQGMKDAGQILKSGRTDTDVTLGKRVISPRYLIDFIGSIHGALKAVPKRNEFVRSFQKRTEFAIKQGLDPTDPLVQTNIATNAYKDANRSIFMQDNRVVSAYNAAVRVLESKSKITGKTSGLGKFGATVAKTILPIVKVPTNIVAETGQYAVGSVTGSVGLGKAFYRGLENVKPEEADLIMRQLKKGSLGAAFIALGYYSADSIGGYYQPGKRDSSDVKFGSIRIGDYNVPSYLIHNPLMECLQIGATINRVAHSSEHGEEKGIASGTMAAATGVIGEVPFVREMTEGAKAFDPRQQGKFLGNYTKGIVVPQGLQWLSGVMDTNAEGDTIKRDPQGVGEYIMSGIPGLREQLPEKTGRGSSSVPKPKAPKLPKPGL